MVKLENLYRSHLAKPAGLAEKMIQNSPVEENSPGLTGHLIKFKGFGCFSQSKSLSFIH